MLISQLREPTDEQNAALDLIQRSLESGGIVTLTGPYGSGKTALARILWDRLERLGVQVFGFSVGAHTRDLGSELSRIIASSSPGPLVIMIDEWDQLARISLGVRKLADFQRLLYGVVSRGPKNGVLLISALPGIESEPDSPNILPEMLLARMVTVRLSTVLRRTTPASIVNPVVTLPRADLQLKSHEALERWRDHFDKSMATGQFDQIDRLLGDSRARLFLATHLVSLAAGSELPGFDAVANLLERARVLERRTGGWAMVGWLRVILDEAGIGPAAYENHTEDVIEKVSASLEALAWERYLRELMSSRKWLESEISAIGIELPLSEGALPTLVARLGRKPQEFVAGLFRSSDLREFAQPGDKPTKEVILENAFRRWQENVR